MKNSFDEKVLEEAQDWLETNKKIVLATVMIINEKGDFSGSVSGGCVESTVVRESINLIKKNKNFKKIEFKISDKSAWDVGLACGGEIAIFLEQIND